MGSPPPGAKSWMDEFLYLRNPGMLIPRYQPNNGFQWFHFVARPDFVHPGHGLSVQGACWRSPRAGAACGPPALLGWRLAACGTAWCCHWFALRGNVRNPHFVKSCQDVCFGAEGFQGISVAHAPSSVSLCRRFGPSYMLALFAGVADVLGEQAVGAYHWVTTKAMGCPSHDLGGVPVTSPVVCVSFV